MVSFHFAKSCECLMLRYSCKVLKNSCMFFFFLRHFEDSGCRVLYICKALLLSGRVCQITAFVYFRMQQRYFLQIVDLELTLCRINNVSSVVPFAPFAALQTTVGLVLL